MLLFACRAAKPTVIVARALINADINDIVFSWKLLASKSKDPDVRIKEKPNIIYLYFLTITKSCDAKRRKPSHDLGKCSHIGEAYSFLINSGRFTMQ